MRERHTRDQGARSTFRDTQAQRDRQDRCFCVCAQRTLDPPTAMALEHQMLDQTATAWPRAVRRNIESKREQCAMNRANQRRAGTLTDFNGHQFWSTLLEANFGLSDHGES